MDIVERLKERGESGATLTEEEMKAVEKILGFRLSTLLRRIYLEVNKRGEFGPEVGLFGFGRDNNPYLTMSGNIIEVYNFLRQKCELWPEKLLPVTELGCDVYLCVDCSTDEGAVVEFEPSLYPHFIPVATSTEQWLAAWLDNPGIGPLNEEHTPYNKEDSFVIRDGIEDDIPF